MPDFSYGDYVYLNDNDEIPKHYYPIFIKKRDPEITITLTMILMEKRLKTFPEIFVKNILVPWL